ncbi:adenosylcobinamide amidohydrolase [Tumebacillus sp. BK434]|uniref:adenosylcobinamide amidohydrolase n=1 Tax=Tumebacillus sp. BK434 TaxID=2512169 RepID=UPI0010EA119A|nr:adenosylcobinamide amidohydrolase [Tumebacillus sp. BK434]TCP55783.1 adenosylcobinamide amidohydrolase [Tumebacillus sp. BK434]
MSEIRHHLQGGALIVSADRPLHIVSSSLFGGGCQQKNYLVNAQVPHGYSSDDPWQDLEQRVHDLGLPIGETAGMMTAADVDQVVEGFAMGDQFRLRTFVTAGVGNAARAGVTRKTYPGYVAGTINIIVAIDGRMTEAALINAVITITEAKTAALQDSGITIHDGSGRSATGTTTDAVIVAATQDPEYSGIHQYAGVATELGGAIADTVYHSLTRSLQHQRTQREQI